MSISFEKLFKDSLQDIETRPGSIIKGTIVSIEKDIVLVDAGLKSESVIPLEQFKENNGNTNIKIGDIIDVSLDSVSDCFGETILSREKAKRHAAWIKLEKIYEKEKNILGIINGKVKGGFTVELNNIRAFLPGSLVDIRPLKDTLHLEGKELEFKVIKLDKKRNNVVVSRRAVIESENFVERNLLLTNLKEGQVISGIVKNLTDYGAFIDLGGLDGLLHITDMAWKRVKNPNEIVNIGDKIKVKILKFDKEKTRVSLGYKQLSMDPWINISDYYIIGTKHSGIVTNLTDYGCFVEIQEGIEGLVHVSEMDWTNKNIHPSKVVASGDKVKICILDIDEERRRISLGIKQCKTNPWKKFSEVHHKGHIVYGKIKSITEFGMFIGLHGGIDGLVHLSDLSWDVSAEKSVKFYKKGDDITAKVLQVDSLRERISLGIKQLTEDPFNLYIKKYKKNSIVSGFINKIEEDRIFVLLGKNVKGCLKFFDISLENKKDFFTKIKIKDCIQSKFLGYDKKNRIIHLSFYKNFIIKNIKN